MLRIIGEVKMFYKSLYKYYTFINFIFSLTKDISFPCYDSMVFETNIKWLFFIQKIITKDGILKVKEIKPL